MNINFDKQEMEEDIEEILKTYTFDELKDIKMFIQTIKKE